MGNLERELREAEREWLKDNDHPETPIGYCVDCGAEIYYGDWCYNIGGDIICEDCINDYKMIAVPELFGESEDADD